MLLVARISWIVSIVPKRISKTFTYDSSGHMLTKNYDEDADGTFDYNERYEYDVNGNLLRVFENDKVKQEMVWQFVSTEV